LSYPLRRGETEWGIVLFSERKPLDRFGAAQPTRLSAGFFVEKADGPGDRLHHGREADLHG
jgi:hypothetical protein